MKREEFVPNNVHLRELTSSCLAKYKQEQAFALNQLCANPKHKFSKTAKEILLLKYDMWFQFLLKTEVDLRRVNDTDECIKEDLIEYADEISAEYTSIIQTHTDIFDQKFVAVWLTSHELMYKYLIERIYSFDGDKPTMMMLTITEVLISVMQNTLFELHEIDALMYETDVFLSFDNICIDYKDAMGAGRCLLTERLEVYQEHFPDRIKHVVVKDYSEKELLINNIKLRTTIEKAINDYGIVVDSVI